MYIIHKHGDNKLTWLSGAASEDLMSSGNCIAKRNTGYICFRRIYLSVLCVILFCLITFILITFVVPFA